MASSELNIVLKLIDDATGQINKSLDQIKKNTEDLKNKQKKSSEETRAGFDKAASSVRRFRRDMLLVAAAFATLIAATKEYAKTNDGAAASLDKLESGWKRFLAAAGKPAAWVVDKVANAAQFWTGGGLGGGGIDPAVEAKNNLARMNEQLKEIDNQFLVGSLNQAEYFRKISENSFLQISMREQEKKRIQDLAQLSNMLANDEFMNSQRIMNERIGLLNFYKETYMLAHQGMAAFTVTLGNAIQNNLSKALTGVITGTMKAKDAFKELGNEMIQVLVDFMVQKVVAWALEKTLLAGQVASSTAAGAAIAAAWGPAAVAVNIASFGAAGAAAAASAMTAGIATATAMGLGGAAGGKPKVGVAMQDTSGNVSGEYYGSRLSAFAEGTPNVPRDMFANIHKGEMVVPANFAESIRSGDVSLGGGGDINVNVYYPKMTNKEEVAELARALGFEISRQSRYARAL